MGKDAIFRWINCRDVGIILMDVGDVVRTTRSSTGRIFNLRLCVNGLKGLTETNLHRWPTVYGPEFLE
jgi:hypothetical protein